MTALTSQLRIFVSVLNVLSGIIVVVRFISVYIFLLPAGLSQILQKILTDKNNLFPRKLNPQATFNPDLVLAFKQPNPYSFHKLFDPFVLKMGLNLCLFFDFSIQLCTYQCQSGRGGGKGRAQGGIFTFSKKLLSNSLPLGKNVRSNITEIPCLENDLWSQAQTKIEISLPRDSKIIQMPYPWAKAIDQNPALCPAFPPLAGLTLIGVLHVGVFNLKGTFNLNEFTWPFIVGH